MNEWKVIFATVLIFGAGVISGGLLVNYADLTHVKMAQTPPAPTEFSNSVPLTVTNLPPHPANNNNNNGNSRRLPEILSKQFVDKLDHDLELTLEQRADIEKIIAQGQDDMRRAVQNVRQDARQKVREQLTPDQKKKFDELFKQHSSSKKQPASTNAPPVTVTTNSMAV